MLVLRVEENLESLRRVLARFVHLLCEFAFFLGAYLFVWTAAWMLKSAHGGGGK